MNTNPNCRDVGMTWDRCIRNVGEIPPIHVVAAPGVHGDERGDTA